MSTSTTTNGDISSQDPWVRTRMCFCDADAPTDCRFHSPEEPGWEKCPNTEAAELGQKLGRWLWKRNPNYGVISAAASESLQEEPGSVEPVQ